MHIYINIYICSSSSVSVIHFDPLLLLPGCRPIRSCQNLVPEKCLAEGNLGANMQPLSNTKVCLECTRHPMLAYLGVGRGLFTVDSRMPGGVSIIGPLSKYAINALCAHAFHTEQLMICEGSEVRLIDVRYPAVGAQIASRMLPAGHTNMKFVPGYLFHDRNIESDVMLSWNESADHQIIAVHSLEKATLACKLEPPPLPPHRQAGYFNDNELLTQSQQQSQFSQISFSQSSNYSSSSSSSSNSFFENYRQTLDKPVCL